MQEKKSVWREQDSDARRGEDIGREKRMIGEEGKARQGKARQGKARQGKTGHDKKECSITSSHQDCMTAIST